MLAAHIELILLLTGVATAGALLLFVAPTPLLKALFGRAPSDGLTLLIARHWGLVVGLVGVLLVYAAYHAEIRPAALALAIVEKLAWALGVFLSPFRRRPQAVVTALADAGMAATYLAYLTGL
jgi:hypothetical protein